MLDFILVGCFTAFLLALTDVIREFIAVFITEIVTNTLFSVSISSLGYYLLGNSLDKSFIVLAIAGAFLGRVLLKITERITTYRPVVINSTRQ